MIDQRTAIAQLKRLRGMPGEPEDLDSRATAAQERAKAIARYAGNPEHAERAISRLLVECKFWPSVAEIVAALRDVPADQAPDGCAKCDGEVWVQTAHGVARCVCAKGQWLRAKDREREAA